MGKIISRAGALKIICAQSRVTGNLGMLKGPGRSRVFDAILIWYLGFILKYSNYTK